MNPDDPIILHGDDAGRLESELTEIVFNPDVSDVEYFLSRKQHFERKARASQSVHSSADNRPVAQGKQKES